MLLLIDPRVKKFIEHCTEKQISKILEYFDLFKEYGFLLDIRYLNKIRGRVWELRPGDIRVFIYEKNNSGIIIHANFKKSKKTTKKDLKVISSRMKQYI